MRGNTILMHLNRGQTSRAGELFQYDYGQKLLFAGVTLPESYEVHFSNQEHGSSKTMLGDATGVDIPDEYLTSGDPVHVWVYLHDGADDGETEYHGIIGVAKRAKPTDQQPTPVQQSIIEQAITALNAGVTEVEGIAEGIPQTIDTALAEAKASGEFDGEKGDPGDDGFSPTVVISEITKGHRVTVTDAEGDHAFDVLDGETPTVPVTDVQINGTTVVTDGVANIPYANDDTPGVIKRGSGVYVNSSGVMSTDPATAANTKTGTNQYKPIVPNRQHEAAFYGLAKADGATSQSASSNAVGN